MQIISERSEYPYFSLAPEEDLLLGLLKKDLQINRCLHDWDDFGVSTVQWPIDLANFILSIMGFPDPTDESWYAHTVSTYVRAVKDGTYSESEATMRLYVSLREQLQKEHHKAGSS